MPSPYKLQISVKPLRPASSTATLSPNARCNSTEKWASGPVEGSRGLSQRSLSSRCTHLLYLAGLAFLQHWSDVLNRRRLCPKKGLAPPGACVCSSAHTAAVTGRMEIDVGSLRCMAPSLGIPSHRHYDPTDVDDAALRLEWAKILFRAGYRLRFPQVRQAWSPCKPHRVLHSRAGYCCICQAVYNIKSAGACREGVLSDPSVRR